MSDRVEQGTAEETTRPLLTVVNPDATAEEIAALVAVFSALGTTTQGAAEIPTQWNAPHRQVRPHYSHGPGGWRSSGFPQHRGRGT